MRFECDQRGGNRLFILTESSTPKKTQQPMDSVADRIARIRMDIMTLQEHWASEGLEINVDSETFLLKGFCYSFFPARYAHFNHC